MPDNAEREAPRYKVIGQATNTGWAVLDHNRKIAWFETYTEARQEADRLNDGGEDAG